MTLDGDGDADGTGAMLASLARGVDVPILGRGAVEVRLNVVDNENTDGALTDTRGLCFRAQEHSYHGANCAPPSNAVGT